MLRPWLVVCFVVCSATAVLGQKLGCGLCQDAVEEYKKVLGNNATLTELIHELQKICSLLPQKERPACDVALAQLVIGINSTDEYVFVKYSPLAVCAILGSCQLDCCLTTLTPEQIHLSITPDPSTMSVSWTTLDETPDSTVRYGLTPQGAHGKWDQEAQGSQITYTSGGWRGYIHTVVITGLKPDTEYYYMVGSADARSLWDEPNWSIDTSLSFVTRSVEGTSVSFATVGDMGGTDHADKSVLHLANLVQDRNVDFVFHLGDIGYADTYELLWDAFMRKIESVAAYAPYMTIPGNHEGVDFDFKPYEARMHMPYHESGSSSPLYYSFDHGPLHFVGILTEGPAGVIPFAFNPDSEQYQWLEKDLALANQKRDQQPWVFVAGHRPLYCSNKHASNCKGDAEFLRVGLEPLLHKYNVDVYLTAHMHSYERTYPLYQNKTVSKHYDGPLATVHVVNGAGGCKEGLAHERFPDVAPDWSAFRLRQNGYGQWMVNRTHAVHQFKLAATNEVVDETVIRKN